MNWFDIVLLVLIGMSIAAGVIKGLIREVFALAGVVLGIVVALVFGDSLGVYLERWISIPSAAYAVAVVSLFILVMILVGVISGVLDRIISVIQLGFANRILGGIFGLVRGVLICIVLVMAMHLIGEEDAEVLVTSKVTPYVMGIAEMLEPFVPEDFRDIFDSGTVKTVSETARGAL